MSWGKLKTQNLELKTHNSRPPKADGLELERQRAAGLIRDVVFLFEKTVPEPLEPGIKSEAQVFGRFIVGAGIKREKPVVLRHGHRRFFDGVR